MLAEGVDVNGANQGGQTALILAALLGRSDVVGLLLEAGADVRLRDNHGLTAIDWAQRRGFLDVTRLLTGFSSAERTTPPNKESSPQRHPEKVTDLPPQPSESGRETASLPENRRSTEEPEQRKGEGFGPAATAMLKAKARQAHLEAEAMRSEPAAEEHISSEPELGWPEKLKGSRADEAPPETSEPETLRARMETERIFEQARMRVEEEVRKKTQHETRRVVERERPPAPKATIETTNVKRCPKCNTIYEGEVRTYCAYDAGRLVSVDESSFHAAAARTFGRPTLWLLVVITLAGSVFVTYLATRYLAEEEGATTPAAASTEAPAKLEENLPVVGGALVGKEINLPNAEYPVKARSAGRSGAVTVMVRVNTKGRVISARALNGEPQLRAAAVKAARKTTFSPEKLAGEGRVVSGTITYDFRP